LLSIDRTKRKWRKFLVYDLEWIPGKLDVRMVGCFDGNRYRWYRTVEDFLACELNRENRGKWFYAHAGGLADIQFLFEKLVTDPRWTIKASFSGSSAIIVHISNGHDSWHFIDSYWLLRDTLRNIGKSIGMEKGGAELSNDGTDEEKTKAWFRDVPLIQLVPYNEQDCVILWRAIDAFQMKLWEFGGQLQMTLASSAMKLFRRQYLTQDIETNDRLNEISRHTYVASRVEVFERECQNAYYLDFNSSFPYSMTQPLPGNFLGGSYGKLPKHSHYIAECDVEVPDCYLPPIAARYGGRAFFPTGRWRGWFNNVDLELLLREGGRIFKVFSTYHFEPFNDLADYAQRIYSLRKASKDDFERYCYKLLLNALYGKFAESNLKDGVFINPSAMLMRTFDPELTQELMPGVFLHPEIVEVPHMHVPISSHVTANSRKMLYEALSQSARFHYADTDGFSSDDYFPTSNELGGLKLEKLWKSAIFQAPKLYHGEGFELKGKEWKDVMYTKAKGFSLGKDDMRARELFYKLIESGEVRVTRMERVKTLLKNGRLHRDQRYEENSNNAYRIVAPRPQEKEIVKRLHKDSIGKRFMYPDGSTRPWTITELRDFYP
jgi:hypothetical protein